MFFAFTDDLKLGITQIDNQHKHLVELIDQLHEAMKSGQGKAAVPKIVDELIKYTKEHFRDEEELARKHGYPKATAHKALHDAFVAKVSDFQSALASGRMTVSLEVSLFLKDWLWRHIEGEDKKDLGVFLKSKGVR